MPIGAKMYQAASSEDSSKDGSKDSKTNKGDKDEPVEGEVVDK